MVDVISFLTLKLFAAHVTGKLVLIGALLVGGGPSRLDQDLAIPTEVAAAHSICFAHLHVGPQPYLESICSKAPVSPDRAEEVAT
jgi:uncharacterized membrane protein YoaK (UPF0700 family)